MFGERLTSYNEGRIVPLYDAFGGSILLDSSGGNSGYDAYPPMCGTRYVESVGGPVSEWMFCTDADASSCGDTDRDGNLIGPNGDPINPMTALDRNPRLTPEQEKLIAYLVQHGHDYDGVGNQAWGGATVARSDGTSDERAALQTLIWCVSDPRDNGSDSAETCAANMNGEEQARLLAVIPDEPTLVLDVDSTAGRLVVGDTATFTLTTNIYNQPIRVVTGGAADAEWAVCSGDAELDGTTLIVTGHDPRASTDVGICATATTVGKVTLKASATPPSTKHIGWSQSQDNIGVACQVYATFHEVDRASVAAKAAVKFREVPDATETVTPTRSPEVTAELTDRPDDELAATGVPAGLLPVGLLLLAAGGVLVAAGLRGRQRSAGR